MNPTLRTVLLSGIVSLLVSAGVVQVMRESSQTAPANGDVGQQVAFDATGAEEGAVVAAVRQAEPAVVSVIIAKDLPVLEQYYEELPGPFGFQVPRVRQRGTELREVGGGTAFFVSDNGLLMTNKHVVSDQKAAYTVLLNDGRRLEATVIARDPLTDIALLQVKGSDFPALSLAPTDDIVLGQTAVAIGNALAEFRNTVSVGVVSGLQRSIVAGDPGMGETEQLHRILQTDAAINQGNSGGPLLNGRGEVIGMNTAVATGAQNIGFAIPVSDLRRALKSFAENGRIVRPYIGVRYVQITPELQKERELPVSEGALISAGDDGEPAIPAGSPAEKAGLKAGDVIVTVDGQKLTSDLTLADVVGMKKPGEEVMVKVLRGKEELEVTVRLEEWKEN
jgi:serine protease Do